MPLSRFGEARRQLFNSHKGNNMADEVQVEVKTRSGVQDTGNPVLDSVVNLLSGRTHFSREDILNLHEIVLSLAAKEPGGLKRRADIRSSGK
jgi:hypothetical protein